MMCTPGYTLIRITNDRRCCCPLLEEKNGLEKPMKSLYREENRRTSPGALKDFNAKLYTLYRINQLLFREKKDSWTLDDICSTITRHGGYLSCWIALVGNGGSIVELSHGNSEATANGEISSRDIYTIEEFIRAEVACSEILLINRAPLLSAHEREGVRYPQDISSVTARLEYNATFFGAITVMVDNTFFSTEDDVIMLNEIAVNVSYAQNDKIVQSKFREMEEMINSLAKNYRTTFETTGTATILIEEDTTIALANSEFENLSGFSKAELEDKISWTRFIAEEDLEMMTEYHRMRREEPSKAPRNYSIRFIDRDHNIKDIYMTVGLIPQTKKSIASFLDVTEQKRLESEILRISEEERRKIGNNLHDGLGPHLVGIKFMLNLLKQKLSRKFISEAGDIDEINYLLDQAITQTRMIVKGICPVDIDAEGLIFALLELSSQVQSMFGITCQLTYEDTITFSDNVVATQLYYIVQEAINNSVKHSQAQNINIVFKKKTGTISLYIDDDGIGIPNISTYKRGMGINIMKYRARVINAILDVIKNQNGGTRVICILKK